MTLFFEQVYRYPETVFVYNTSFLVNENVTILLLKPYKIKTAQNSFSYQINYAYKSACHPFVFTFSLAMALL